MIRLLGVLSITSKIAQEEGRVLEIVLRKGDSATILLRLCGVLKITSRGPMLGKGPSVTISLRQRAFTN